MQHVCVYMCSTSNLDGEGNWAFANTAPVVVQVWLCVCIRPVTLIINPTGFHEPLSPPYTSYSNTVKTVLL